MTLEIKFDKASKFYEPGVINCFIIILEEKILISYIYFIGKSYRDYCYS